MTNRWLLEKLKELSEEKLDRDFDHSGWFRCWIRQRIPPRDWS